MAYFNPYWPQANRGHGGHPGNPYPNPPDPGGGGPAPVPPPWSEPTPIPSPPPKLTEGFGRPMGGGGGSGLPTGPGTPIGPSFGAGYYANQANQSYGPTVDVPSGPWSVEPPILPGNQPPPQGGYPINVQVGGGPGATMGPTNINTYDAGNGVIYYYDSNWNYIGSNSSPQGPAGAPQGPPSSSPGQAAVPTGGTSPDPYGGGGTPPPAWVGREAQPQPVVGQSNWEGATAQFSSMLINPVTAKNI